MEEIERRRDEEGIWFRELISKDREEKKIRKVAENSRIEI